MKKYLPRLADSLLNNALESTGAVLIEGPKWCGKTTTAEQTAKSILYLQDPSKKEQYLALARIDPSQLLDGDNPRLIDEWQLAPTLWDAIRFQIDKKDKFGLYILTGSSVPRNLDKISHTGVGRISRIKMRTMTLYESGDSNGKVSLSELFKSSGKITGNNPLNLEKLAFLVCRGGWPKSLNQSERISLKQSINYYDALVSSDISRVDDVKKDDEKVKLLMRAYSRNVCTQASNVTLKKDIIKKEIGSIDEDTIASYINALKKLFIVDEIDSWNLNIRSKTSMRTTPVRQFIDPSIATAALDLGPKDLINDLHSFGFLFQSLCSRDLKSYAESLNGNIYHYRDKTDLECDVIIHLKNGKWAAFEIKLGNDEEELNDAANHLIKLRKMVEKSKKTPPSFLMIISGTASYAYQREDGVYICPIGCLKN